MLHLTSTHQGTLVLSDGRSESTRGFDTLCEHATDIAVTADHIMSAKDTAIDLEVILGEDGDDVTVIH